MASRVQTAVTMRQVTGSMAGVVRGMEGAMKAMDLEKVDTPMFPRTQNCHCSDAYCYAVLDLSSHG